MTSAAFGLLTLGLLVPSIVLHEVAHGWVSLRLGDPTARNAGRLSLNPLRHLDLFGTVLLPLMLWSSGAPVFGYAKPVPINPAYYRDVRRGQLRTSLAGPAANLLLAGAGSAAAWLAWTLGAPDCRPLAWAWLFAGAFVEVNLVLMFFNLIPIPPSTDRALSRCSSRTRPYLRTTGSSGMPFRSCSRCAGASRPCRE
ncbi:MAG TPA: site-2 protease family protein [Vicinamibacterales bacterium]|nr:site-2 protease family protein [Vicinamibacterales bacterium]HPW20749.1 site-2 protease family protein [Vicinamibacterales bacterium]